MVDRNYIYENFPAISCRRPSLYDLALTLWSPEQASRLVNVDNWTDLIDLDLEGFGRSGFGAILYLMEADMLWAFLPAWLVIGLEQRSNFENVVPVAVALLNPHQISVEEADRFTNITEKANPSQKLAISAAILELADLHYQGQPDSQSEMAAISEYWRQSA